MGLGAALIFPATLSLLTNVFTERRERARAIGLWGASTGVGIAVGPIVGGWLLEHFSWQSVFFALVPLAVSFRRVGWRRGPDLPGSQGASGRPPGPRAVDHGDGRIDLHDHRGAAARVGGRPQRRRLRAGGRPACCLHRLGAEGSRPMLDIALFRNLRFSAASAAVTITFFSLLGFIFVITLYFQFLKGYGPLSTGIRLLPVAILTGITSVLGTRLAVRSGTKLVVAGGLVSLAVGLAWASTNSSSTSYLTIAPSWSSSAPASA